MTLRELFHDRIAPLKDLSQRSVVMYDSSLDRFRDFLGHEPDIGDLDDLVLSKFLRWRATTVHAPWNLRAACSMVMRSSVVSGWLILGFLFAGS